MRMSRLRERLRVSGATATWSPDRSERRGATGTILLFHFIRLPFLLSLSLSLSLSFSPLLFFCFFIQTRRTDDADVCHRSAAAMTVEAREKGKEKGRGAARGEGEGEREGERKGRQGRRGGGKGCGREKSFNVKVTWAHAHRIDRTQRRDGAEAARSAAAAGGGGGEGSRERAHGTEGWEGGGEGGGGGRGLASLGRMLSPAGIRCILPAASGRQKYNANCVCWRGPKMRAVSLLSKHAGFI